jgi:hypothetical protein
MGSIPERIPDPAVDRQTGDIAADDLPLTICR